ncbi:MAG: lipopolysaccharide/colanic/teichoic acid biosynthesis glycosyltransferase [Crocinitomicaceae bacterium]|jgi:lipopolysaccharide/colanic/teichoic acid biosynthesis glycosyltransferase
MQRVFAFLLVVLISPLLLLTLGLIWIIERENPIFIQQRIGYNKQPFSIYKVRTMKAGRITLLGKVLRKTGIDEIPQLINIIKGEMKFVGPRPLTEADILRLHWNDDAHKRRWTVKPGITGLAQLINVCDATVSWNNDITYIDQVSVRLDLRIIWHSILIPFVGKRCMKQMIHKSST